MKPNSVHMLILCEKFRKKNFFEYCIKNFWYVCELLKSVLMRSILITFLTKSQAVATIADRTAS